MQLVPENNQRLEIDEETGQITFFIGTDNKFGGTYMWLGSVDELFQIIWKETDYQFSELTVPDMEQRIDNEIDSSVQLQKISRKLQ